MYPQLMVKNNKSTKQTFFISSPLSIVLAALCFFNSSNFACLDFKWLNQRVKKNYLAIFILLLFAVLLYFSQQIDLELLKTYQSDIAQLTQEHSLLISISFFFIYLLCAAFSLPIASLLSLLGGATFGVIKGTLLVSFASSIGATLAFLTARYFLKDSLEKKFPQQIANFQDKFTKNGNSYLLSMRLIPLFPFYLVNLVFGLTKIKTLSFYLYSQLGMLPATIIYLNAGSQLAKIESLKDVVSPTLLISLSLLGIFPLILKKFIKLP